MEIYPVNSPTAPKTVFGPGPAGGSGSGRTRVSISPVVRTKRLPTSAAISTKPFTSPTTTTRPLPTPTKAPFSPILSARPTYIRCVCRMTQDDRGQTVMRDGCTHRQHARCYGLGGTDGGDGVRWICGLCDESKGGWRPVEKEEARDIVEDDVKMPEPEPEPQVQKELVEQVEVTVEMERGGPVEEAQKGEPVVSADVEMESAVPEIVNKKEKEPVKEPEVEKINAKAAKSGTSAIIPPLNQPLTPTVQTVAVHPGPTKASGSPSKPSPSRSASASKPASSSRASTKVKSIKAGSRVSSMNGSSMVRARPLSPEPTPSAPLSPRSQSPAANEPDEPLEIVELAPKIIEKAPTPPPSNPSPIATRAALPSPSPPRPPTPLVPSPPKPSPPRPDAGDNDIDATLWATEYDHINANIVDASLRERLWNFSRERLAQRATSRGYWGKTNGPSSHAFTSAEPVFLTASQLTSLVRGKEINPPRISTPRRMAYS
ncbi:hypothetical protein RhiJN_13667 [Ceratobasidium sp. AG-Ba]|nr:hypothetical protein RhiJN_13667 [Ceratobasidium sp. AG-Ba]QRW07832.1 hypothetical protein RhiLY_06831 [Ceratobasidium sp. AG-Ba]QRW14223.1 hypothetical protein RhiLY_13222 [Ceratobasidium sp. AG-Ba]